MAYLPYRMYGNGGFHLPIIDIVQTINSSSLMHKRTKLTQITSSKGFGSFKKEFDCARKPQMQLPSLCERKSASYDLLPKESFVREEKDGKKRSKTKMVKFRKNGCQNTNKTCNYCCERESECLGEKKSLQVLFRASKNGNPFDKDEPEEEELSFSSLSGPISSSTDLKRKASFVDYIKIKKRKKVGLFARPDQELKSKNYLFRT